MRGFVELVSNVYNLLVRAQALNHRDRLNGVVGDEQRYGTYLSGYRVCVSNDAHFLCVDKADSEKGRRGSIAPPRGGNDVFEDRLHAGPSQLTV